MFQPTEDPSLSTEERTHSEHVLLSQAQTGDEQAFKKIYERYFGSIALYLSRMVGKDDIGCELAQDTFLKVWRALPTLRQREAFASWLYRIATRVAYDYQRHEKQASCSSYDKEPLLLTWSSLEGPEEQIVAQEMLRLALAQIPFKYRACLVLYHVQGYSKQKIALLLGIQENSVNTYISLGMEAFRRIHHRLQDDQATKIREEES